MTPAAGFIDPTDPASIQTREVDITDGYVLMPGTLALGSVRESFDCTAPLRSWWGGKTYYYPVIAGRSTFARVGCGMHITAGEGDWGFVANFTLELTAQVPIILRPGYRAAQVYFKPLAGKPSAPYKSVYSRQTGPQAPILGRERVY